jgi:hypothetical protein
MDHLAFQRVGVADEDQFKLLVMAGVSFSPLKRTIKYQTLSMNVFASLGTQAGRAGQAVLEEHYGLRIAACKEVQTSIGPVVVFRLTYRRTEQLVVPLGIIDKDRGCLIPAEFTNEAYPLVFTENSPSRSPHQGAYYVIKGNSCHVIRSARSVISYYRDNDQPPAASRGECHGMQLFATSHGECEGLRAKADSRFFTEYQSLLYGNSEFHERNYTLYGGGARMRGNGGLTSPATPEKVETFPPPLSSASSWQCNEFLWEVINEGSQLYLNEGASSPHLLVGKRIVHAGKEYFQSMSVSADSYIEHKANPQDPSAFKAYDKQLSLAFRDKQKEQAPAPEDVFKAMRRYGKTKLTTEFAIEKSCEEGVRKFKSDYGIEEDVVTLATLANMELRERACSSQRMLIGNISFLKVVGALCSKRLSESNPLHKKVQGSVQVLSLPGGFSSSQNNPGWAYLACLVKEVCKAYFIDASVFDLEKYENQKTAPGCYAISLAPAKGQSKFRLKFTLILV